MFDRRGRLADDVAAYLRDRLTDDRIVLTHYAPRDSADEKVAVAVIGAPGVTVIEPRDEQGEIVCVADHWYRLDGHRATHRIEDSPSRRARWNATRVRSDIATAGFLHTPVEAIVVFTRGRLGDCTGSCVMPLEGGDAVVRHLLRSDAPAAVSQERVSALADVLVGALRLAAAG